jgi:DNA-binding NtrC family response regulator
MLGKEGVTLDPVAEDMLMSYAWPGNVRELENVIERAMLMCELEIKPEHLGIHVRLDIAAIQDSIRSLPEITSLAVKKSESEAIERALHMTGGNKSRAADLLGVSYKTLLIKIKDYGVVFNDGRSELVDEDSSGSR